MIKKINEKVGIKQYFGKNVSGGSTRLQKMKEFIDVEKTAPAGSKKQPSFMKKDLRFSRRDVLKKLGVSAAMLPLIQSDPTVAQEDDARRLVCITMCNGNIPDDFHAFHDGTSYTLRGLNPFKEKVTTIRGCGMQVMLDAGKDYDGHFSHPTQLTGAVNAANASLDHIVAEKIAQSVQLTKKQLNLGVRSERDGPNTSYRAAGQANPNEVSSQGLFNSLFESVSLPVEELDAITARKGSVLDFVGKELENFGGRVGYEDKQKIQAHLNSVRELELQLGVNGPACSTPDVNLSTGVPDRMDAMFKMMSAAIRCDFTRVITMEMYDNGGGNGNTFPWIDVNRDYHEVAHEGLTQEKRDIDRWLFDLVGEFLGELDSFAEGGGTVLDNCAVLIGNDMETGHGHWIGKINYALVGGLGGLLNTGQRLSLNNVPHNRLLTTLAQTMGVDTDRIGQTYSGNIPELLNT